MRILFFGTYDRDRHPRVAVLVDGLRPAFTVQECNRPIAVETASRVAAVQRPWRAIGPLARLVAAWVKLWRGARSVERPDVVVVGYLGVLDVHLARWLWRDRLLILDHLAPVGATARDRQLGGVLVRRVLDWLDRKAIESADRVLVDTEESLGLVPASMKDRAVVIAVGAADEWFRAPERRDAGPLRVVFFGLYTPLQGATVIGQAISRLAGTAIEFTMIGHGQDLGEARRAAGGADGVTWIEWVDPRNLPDVVSRHDVCLGIFGAGRKAQMVVPTKVYQGAAAGCAIVTSDTPPQRRALGDGAMYVPSGDSDALTSVLARLANDPAMVWSKREAAYRHAGRYFRSTAVVQPLVNLLRRGYDGSIPLSATDGG